jgi:RNA polymerase sporulation-specific sigma factor
MNDNFKERIIRAREDEKERLKITESFEPLIKKCIKMYLKDFRNYEDALQEGRVAVFSCINNYDLSSPIQFPGYVKMAVIYGIRDFASKYRENISLDEEIAEGGGSLHDILRSDFEVDGEQLKRDELDELQVAISKLPEKQRKVIEEFYFQGKTLKEMCVERRCHYMNVVKMKERAIKGLRGIMGE